MQMVQSFVAELRCMFVDRADGIGCSRRAFIKEEVDDNQDGFPGKAEGP